MIGQGEQAKVSLSLDAWPLPCFPAGQRRHWSSEVCPVKTLNFPREHRVQLASDAKPAALANVPAEQLVHCVFLWGRETAGVSSRHPSNHSFQRVRSTNSVATHVGEEPDRGPKFADNTFFAERSASLVLKFSSIASGTLVFGEEPTIRTKLASRALGALRVRSEGRSATICPCCAVAALCRPLYIAPLAAGAVGARALSWTIAVSSCRAQRKLVG